LIYRHVDVALGERSYPIYIGEKMVASFAPTCEQHGLPKRMVVITDSNVAKLHLQPLLKNLKRLTFDPLPIVVPAGERQKSLRRAEAIYTEMLKRKVDRRSTVLAFGGGVIGDLAGFVAATYQRGVALVQVPTTLLAQVDSSIGGKVGVNHPLGKNMIGAFYQPKFVWTDLEMLRTLPDREVVCGLGEVIKYGVILDRDLFHFLEERLEKILTLDGESFLHVQARCAELKAEVTSRDEREAGLRAILNFGHTVGHALEAAGRYKTLKHGEAVLLGMIAESLIATELGLLPREEHERIVALIRRVPMRASLRSLQPSEVIAFMAHDKKSVEGKNRFVLPTRIGEVEVVENVEHSLLRSALASTARLYSLPKRQ